jgi:16S rRNA (cytidine1402-2'-O)-methyltransferase
LRALDILASVDLILAEDTRITARLLTHYGITTPTRALHRHNERQNIAFVLESLRHGQSVALVSDAGTPAISDPGARLVAAVRDAQLRVSPIPGASALTAAISATGLVAERHFFVGFLPPQKKACNALLERLHILHAMPLRAALIFYEAPHRVRDTAEKLVHYFGATRPLIIARELTKTFETIARISLGDAPAWIAAHPETECGEIVLILDIDIDDEAEILTDEALARWLPALLEELSPARAARVAAASTGIERAVIYEEILRLGKLKAAD